MEARHFCSLVLSIILGVCGAARAQEPGDGILFRYLPEAYTPGKVVHVTLEGEPWRGSSLYGQAFGVIPEGWQLVGCDRPLTDFDEACGTLHWRLGE